MIRGLEFADIAKTAEKLKLICCYQKTGGRNAEWKYLFSLTVLEIQNYAAHTIFKAYRLLKCDAAFPVLVPM